MTKLDSGWTGLAHNADIDNEVVARGFLDCPGHGPTCGQCNVIGVDPSERNCRCSNNTRTICDEPFKANVSECPACLAGPLSGNPCAANADCTAGLECVDATCRAACWTDADCGYCGASGSACNDGYCQ